MYLMGVDIGTTGCKAIIFSAEGRVISSVYGEYRLLHRRPEWSELDAEEVWATVVKVVRASVQGAKVEPKAIVALSTSVLGEAFIPIDREGKPLYGSMTTFDARAEVQTARWEENFGAERMFQITGQPLARTIPIYTLQKIQWIKEYEPAVYRKAFKFLCWEDYANMKLCGNPVIDYSVASRTMMFDIRKKQWSREILDTAGLDEALLPEVAPSGKVVGEVTTEAAEVTGLAKGTLVVTGGHDQPCGALGVGLLSSGPVMDATGTVECVAVVQDELTLTDAMRRQGFSVQSYVMPERYLLFGFNPNGGVVLRWFRDNFAHVEREAAKAKGLDVYDILMEEAGKAAPGAMKLFLLPFFEGSGCPNFNRQARGVLLGLTLAQSRGEVIRAFVEGLTFEFRNILEAIGGHGIRVTELRAIGGGAKSRFWLQLKADVTGRKVVAPDVTEAAALGAAILAGVAAKTYTSMENAVKTVYREKAVYTANEATQSIYEKHYGVYKKLHPALNQLFKELENL